MATTTNFGWETPDDSDLVKDGAAAMRTLGNSIDASMADLRGGTSGQILSKNSNTDMDFTWIANDQGDITAVTAGTGISGGGTSGAVTITNSMATEITAKGDLIVGTGNATFDNLPVGTNGYTLVADSTEATGLKWAAASSGAVVQVKSFYSTTTTNTTSATFADTALTIDITPTSASNKVLVFCSFIFYSNSSTNNIAIEANLVRTSTQLTTTNQEFYDSSFSGAQLEMGCPGNIIYLDSPATTSSTTYKCQTRRSQGNATARFIARSITVMEVTP